MKEIASDVFIESSYAGVTLGAVRMRDGLLFIDAPLYARDAQSWRSSMVKPGSSSDRLLVLLDEHPDRSGGAKAMKCTTIAHERASQSLSARPSTSKPAGSRSGSLWEIMDDLGTLHGIQPEITFTHSMAINWSDEPVVLEHHAGPSRGSTWVFIVSQKVVFIGDSVLSGQPPFLASADLESWQETLNLLRSARYRDFIIISSRSQMVTQEDIKAQLTFLKHVQSGLERMAQHNAGSAAMETLVSDLMKGFSPKNRKEEEMYRSRLAWGLLQCFNNHYHPGIVTADR